MNMDPHAYVRSLPPEGAQAARGNAGASSWPLAARREV
jgi:hypothetical protein